MDRSIAIVGMSCRFAGCASPAALWDVILSRRNLLTKLGSDIEIPFGQKPLFGKPYPSHYGALGSLYSYVPAVQNQPRQLNAGENQDLYFATQLAFDALADASIKPHVTQGLRGTVRIGYAPPFNSSTINWLQHTAFLDQTLEILRRFMPTAPAESLDSFKARLGDSLPEPNAASFLLGTGYRFASWIARECGFSGVATITDAGMLTGAVAITDAIDDLLNGRADVALAGALTPPLSRIYLEGLSGEVPFSQRYELHPYAEEPDGTLPGEGGAFFVLKRRSDALRDHDRIYALLRSVALGHGSESDCTAIWQDAAKAADVPIASIGLVEGDGGGIKTAETREIATIQKLWGPHEPGGPLVGLGSVKGNIGHTLHAAMAAGVIKTALALYHRVLPPQYSPIHPANQLSNLSSSVYLLTEARPWISGDSKSPRRAAVFGANFDAVNPIGNAAVAGRSAVVIMEEEPEVRA